MEEGRVDQVDPGERQRSERGDRSVEEAVDVAPSATLDPGDSEEADAEEQVSRQGDEVGEQCTCRGEVAECLRRDAERATDQEREERGAHRDPGCSSGRVVPADPDDHRHGRTDAEEHEREVGGRAEEAERDGEDPAGPQRRDDQ